MRELKHWASLVRVLCERGWPVLNSLAAAWRHIYVSCEHSADSRAAAERAFDNHCSGLAAEDVDASPLSLGLSALNGWPEPTSTADIASDSQLATLRVDGAVLMHLLRQLLAAEVACTGQGLPDIAWAQSVLPGARLKAHLHGSAASGMDPQLDAEVLQAGTDEGVHLLWWGAACFAQRMADTDWQKRMQWLEHLVTQVSCLKPISQSSSHPRAELPVIHFQVLQLHVYVLKLLCALQASNLHTGIDAGKQVLSQAAEAAGAFMSHPVSQELLSSWSALRQVSTAAQV